MKNLVIKALKEKGSPKKQFNKLVGLFIQHNEHNPNQARFLNRAGFSPSNLEMLKYDIMKLYGISSAALRKTTTTKDNSKKQASKKPALNIKALEAIDNAEEFVEKIKDVNFEEVDYFTELKPLATHLANLLGEELQDQKKETLIEYLEKTPTESQEDLEKEVSEKISDAPDEVKAGVKLRVEFPFLAEDDCPDKLKVLVADKLTALQKYEEADEQIQKLLEENSKEDLYPLAKKAVENFELNQQIYDELNYYNDKKEILGNHPIFADEMMQKTVDSYKMPDLVKRKANLENYIPRDKKKLEEIEEKEKREKFEAKIADWQKELDLIYKRLEGNDKK